MKRLPLLPVSTVFLCAVVATLYFFGPFRTQDSYPDERWNNAESTTPVDSRLIDSHTEFAFNLFREMARREPDKNVVVCPPSIALTLSMTYNGAEDRTKSAIGNVLQTHGMSINDLNAANTSLLSNLHGLGTNVQLQFANALWGNKDIDFSSNFLKQCKTSYGAEMTSLDFSNPASVSTVNDWVERKTRGRIDKIVDAIKPLDVMVITNTAYFRGIWSDQFDKAHTQNMPFHLADGSKKNVPMMNESDMKVGNYTGKDFRAVAIPYGKGRVRMYIFLPNERTDLEPFYKQLNSKNWNTWMSAFHDGEQAITMPKFKMKYGQELTEVLKSLGMRAAFDPSQADFGKMCSLKPVWISEIKHKTFIDVNEQGTEAAAATEEMLTTGIAMMPFIVDRPFFFAIRDDKTGEILFMGSIMDPTEAG